MKESVSAWPSSNPAPRPATSSDVEKRIRVAFVEDDDDPNRIVRRFQIMNFSLEAPHGVPSPTLPSPV